MVLDDLGTSLRSSLDKLQGKSRLSESDVEEIVKEIQRSLLSADVDVSLVMELSDSIKTRALEEEPPGGTTAKDHVLKIVYEEMVELVGDSTELPLENQTILLAGLQGSGKTTSAAKMAWWFSKKGLRPAVIQTDTFRPGAYDQAKQMCERAEVDFYGDPDNDDPVAIAREGLEATADADVHIVDTAGRHALEDDLIAEIEEIERAVDPDRSLLVLDAAIGQGAKEQARQFEKSIGIEGVMITKLDGTARGGGCADRGQRDRLLHRFPRDRRDGSGYRAVRALRVHLAAAWDGRSQALSERVERAMAEAQEEDEDWDPEDMLQGEFTLKDMKRQMDAMNRMGPSIR